MELVWVHQGSPNEPWLKFSGGSVLSFPSLCDVSVSNNPFVPLLCDNRSAILCLSLKMKSPKRTVNQVVLFCCDPPCPCAMWVTSSSSPRMEVTTH